MESDSFVCLLCRRAVPVFDAVTLDNCTCLFCSPCLIQYVQNLLNRQSLRRTEAAFHHHHRPRLYGVYIDDVGIPRSIQTLTNEWKGSWGDSEIDVKMVKNGEVVKTRYWRLFFMDRPSSSGQLEQCFQNLCCPKTNCQGFITKSEIRELCKTDFESYLCTESMMESFFCGYINCPKCGCLIERLQDLQGLLRLQENGLTPEMHGEHYRFRCAGCQNDFCGVCLATPYHTHLNCYLHKLPDCRYCGQKLTEKTSGLQGSATAFSSLSIRQLKTLVKEAHVNKSWCIEKSDYVWLAEQISLVCRREDCQKKLRRRCTKRLPCGHGCCGVETHKHSGNYKHRCLPCFEPSCAHSSSELDGCPICWESFSSNLTIRLECNHLIHLDCARERLKKGYPGPSISFNHLFCSMCGQDGDGTMKSLEDAIPKNSLWHPLLEDTIRPIIELRKLVGNLAMERLRINGGMNDRKLQRGGEFEGRPLDFALSKYLFFECYTCKKPYCGGKRQCQAAADENGGDYDPKELICGHCSIVAGGHDCKIHGTAYIEWKCKYCCNIASWFCWGTTHMCHSCHASNYRADPRKACPGQSCPLKVPHPQPGTEFCLGCSLCRHHYD